MIKALGCAGCHAGRVIDGHAQSPEEALIVGLTFATQMGTDKLIAQMCGHHRARYEIALAATMLIRLTPND
jgi:hypothetical protein